MTLAEAFLNDEDPDSALDRLTIEGDGDAADAFAQIIELVAVMNAELALGPASSSWRPSTTPVGVAGFSAAQPTSQPVAAALSRVGVNANVLDRLKRWLVALRVKLAAIARAFAAASYTIGVSGPVPTVSVSITFNP